MLYWTCSNWQLRHKAEVSWHSSDVFIVDFEHIQQTIKLLLATLNMNLLFFESRNKSILKMINNTSDLVILWLLWFYCKVIKISEQTLTCIKSIIETLNRCEVFSKLTIKTPERLHWRCSGVFIVNFKYSSHPFLVFLLLSLNR